MLTIIFISLFIIIKHLIYICFLNFRLITIRYTAPVENLFLKRRGMKSIGEKIVKLIYDMNFDNHPIFFHVFSNGGAFLYQHIALAIKRTNRPLQVRNCQYFIL